MAIRRSSGLGRAVPACKPRLARCRDSCGRIGSHTGDRLMNKNKSRGGMGRPLAWERGSSWQPRRAAGTPAADGRTGERDEDGLRQDPGRHAGRALRAEERQAHGQGHDLRGDHHRDRRARPQRQAGRRRPRLRQPGRLPGQGSPTSAPRSAGSPTGSPRASSPSTARTTRWPPTTAPTRCTAGSRASTRSSGRPRPPVGTGRPVGQADVPQPRRRGRLPGQPVGQRHLHRDRQGRARRSTTRPRPTRPRRSTSPTTATSTWPAGPPNRSWATS